MTDTPPPGTTPPGPGTPSGTRRAAPARRPRPRVDVVLVVASVLVLVAAGLALTTRVQPTGREGSAAAVPAGAVPGEEPVTRTSLVCPSTGGGDDGPATGQARVATTTDASGAVAARSGADVGEVDVAPRRSARLPAEGGEDGEGGEAVIVQAEGDLAPGLVAARTGTPAAAAVAACVPPAFDQWFTGVGAGAEHASVLELTNPDGGRAVADVTVLGRNGPVDVPRLRGLAVAGGETLSLALADVVPRREDLTVRVEVSRGRVAAAVLDRVAEVGRPALGSDWLVPQAAPASDNLLLGVPPGDGDRFLTLANPGPDEGRARVEVVTGSTVFLPEDAQDVVVPPRTTVRVPVGTLLASDPGADTGPDTPLGLRVGSTVPLTAALRSQVEGDLALTSATPPTATATAALLPGGGKQLVLGGASGPGVVQVRSWSGRGRELPSREVDVDAGRASTLDLPGAARLVVLTPSGGEVASAVVLTTDGAAVVAPRELRVTQAVPSVDPGLS